MKTRIRELRRLRGWTLRSLAERIDTTPQTVQRLETGDIAVTADWLSRFGSAFGVHPADLLGGTGARSIELLGGLDGSGRLQRQEPGIFALDVPAEQPVAVRLAETVGPYPRGAILIGNILGATETAAIQTCDAIVALDEATVLLRRLLRGAIGHFILVPLDVDQGEVHYDVVPRWVAPLVMRVDYL
ncbi:transcriptional regulator with XRE-family HTH domain [Rhodoligotrophos appendicifer]|uniref:helix-turn-helix domain-containing protein n=1 Tax=Rhodoligotrophos appendicifer TaxID=987056 RepID=UPI0011854013|nr:helix-turn-helix transcriptional regulator [Rhodoligotrophos appendicifer]